MAEIPSIQGCYALMPTQEEALAELRQVFETISAEYANTAGLLRTRYRAGAHCPLPRSLGSSGRTAIPAGIQEQKVRRPVLHAPVGFACTARVNASRDTASLAAATAMS